MSPNVSFSPGLAVFFGSGGKESIFCRVNGKFGLTRQMKSFHYGGVGGAVWFLVLFCGGVLNYFVFCFVFSFRFPFYYLFYDDSCQ